MTVSGLQACSLIEQLESMAGDVGRLRRRLVDDEYGSHLVDRVALGLEGLDSFLQPDAATLYRVNFAVSGDDDLSAELALEHVDARARRLGELLGQAPR